MRRVPLTDALWLAIERGNQPMHVGGLQLFDLPKDAPPTFLRDLSDAYFEHTRPESPFNREPVLTRSGYFWKDDQSFDLAYHFRHTALAQPARIRELLEFVSRSHGQRLDRSRPLWSCHLIEGLPDNRFAMYTKVHHSMFDGIAATRHMQRMMAKSPDAGRLPPPWALPKPQRAAKPAPDPYEAFNQGIAAARAQMSSFGSVAKALSSAWQNRHDSTEVAPMQAPRSPLNTRVSSSRRFAAQSYSLERIRAVGKATGASVNDVVMAMCAGALREYLIDLKALPKDPLIAMVPVSFRHKTSNNDEDAGGNAVGMVLANLATHLADPGKRLQAIHDSIGHAKERLADMSPAAVVNYSGVLMAPMLLPLVTGQVPKKLPFNVIISNVPGPEKPLYWNGAKLSGSYPVSIVIDGIALNITCVSYDKHMEFGLIGCRRALPHLQRMLEHLETALVDLEDAATRR